MSDSEEKYRPIATDEACASTSVPTPTQKIREKILAFSFDESLTPTLRRSPRKPKPYIKFEEVESVLPTLPHDRPPRPTTKKRPSSRNDNFILKREDLKREEDEEGSPKKKARSIKQESPKKAQFAPPEKYAHLKELPDHLGQAPDMLDILFCGINPGQESATVGHHFAHRSNHFWRCLHGSGLTDRLLNASEDGTIPEMYNLGLTNLVDRPSAQAAELDSSEFTAGVPALLRKIVSTRPRIVCFVGKEIWEKFIRATVSNPDATQLTPTKIEVKTEVVLTSDASGSTPAATTGVTIKDMTKRATTTRRRQPKVKIVGGLQQFKIVHDASDAIVRETLFFAATSTSARVSQYQLSDKVEQFSQLKEHLAELKARTLDTSSMIVIPSSL